MTMWRYVDVPDPCYLAGEMRRIPDSVKWIPDSKNREFGTQDACEAFEKFMASQKVERLAISAEEEKRIRFHLTHRPVSFEAHRVNVAILPLRNATPLHAAIYWNDIDQQVHELRVQLLSLFGNRLRHLFRNLDDRISVGSTARLLIEVSLRYAYSFVFIRSAYAFLSENSDGSIYYTYCWELSKFLQSTSHLTKKEHEFIRRILNADEMPSFEWLEADFAPTMTEQMAILAFFIKQQDALSEGLIGFQRALMQIEKMFAFLCKFVHPSPLMHSRSERLNNLTDSKLDEIVAFVAVQACGASCQIIEHLADIFWNEMRFLDLLKLHIYKGAVRPERVRISFLKDMLSRHRPIVLRAPDGTTDTVIYSPDQGSEGIKKMLANFRTLSESERREIAELIAHKVATRKLEP